MKTLLTFLFVLITIASFSQGITVTVGQSKASDASKLNGKDGTFYLDTINDANIFGIKTFKTSLQVGDSLFVSFFDTVYKESLNERDFATSTKWITTGSFSISAGKVTFSGTSGTLSQIENKLALTGLSNSKYRFIYTVSNMTGVGCTAFINTDFASSNTDLVLVNAIDTLTFTSNSDPTDFKIECTCTSGGFDLDDFSLKKKSDSIVFIKNDLYAGGIFVEGSSAFSGDVQILGSLKGGSPLIISTPIGEIEIDGDIHLIKDDENWTIGIDTSDADQFKISNDDTLGINDRLVIDAAGNVGIGTSSPGGDLDIGDGLGSAELRVTGQGGKIRFLGNSDPNNFIQSGTAYSSGSTSDLFFTGMFGTPNHMVIKANGNVGIGTVTPDRALEISGTSNNTASVRISSFGSGFSSRVEIKRANGTEASPTGVFAGNQLGQIAYMGHDGTSSADAALIHAVANQNWAVGSHGSRLEFVTILDNTTAFVTRMTIANDGNVGIGTATPDVSLQVVGGIRARGGSPGVLGVNNNGYAFEGNGGDVDAGMFSSADGQVEFYTNSFERMRIDDNGVSSVGFASKLLNVSTSVFETAVAGTEYHSPNQHGSIFGTIFRRYYAIPDSPGLNKTVEITMGFTLTGRIVELSGISLNEDGKTWQPMPFVDFGSASRNLELTVDSNTSKIRLIGGTTQDWRAGGFILLDYTK